jgi:hypothetical protein
MSKKFNLYLGKGGQFASMACFLVRGWNVATPEVDTGDDLFVIEDAQGFFVRVQVKTSQAIERQNGFSARFLLPLDQLQKRYNPELYYVFMVLRHHEWVDKIIIPRSDLLDLHLIKQIGTTHDGYLNLYFSFQNKKVVCSEIDITEFYNNFNDFPVISH